MAVPVTLMPCPVVDIVWSGVTLSIPDSESLASKCTVTTPLYQPSTSGDVVAAPVIFGGVSFIPYIGGLRLLWVPGVVYSIELHCRRSLSRYL